MPIARTPASVEGMVTESNWTKLIEDHAALAGAIEEPGQDNGRLKQEVHAVRFSYKRLPDGASLPKDCAIVTGCLRSSRAPPPGRRYFRPDATILRRTNAICVIRGNSFGHTSWHASRDMQPNTPVSSPINS